jgi:hypothetical protein
MAWEAPAADRPVWCSTADVQSGTSTAQSANCTTKDPSGEGLQVAALQLPASPTNGRASDAPADMVPAALHYEKFTSQDRLGHFLLKQYHIRTPNELSSCEVCHR